MPEFSEWDQFVGQSQGRLARSYAEAGDYLYSLTDENQLEIELDQGGSTWCSITQSVDVTNITALFVWVRWKASPTHQWNIQAGIAAVDTFQDQIQVGDADQDWRLIVIPCGKLTGSQTIYVNVNPVGL